MPSLAEQVIQRSEERRRQEMTHTPMKPFSPLAQQAMQYGNDVLSGRIAKRGIDDMGRAMTSGDPAQMLDYIGPGVLATKGAKLARAALPMDEASRMGRAGDYNVSGYHGTGSDIDQFKGTTWLSDTPDLASRYATMRYHVGGGNPAVMPLKAKSGASFDADRLPDTVTADSFVNEMLVQAKAAGVDVDVDKAKGLLNKLRQSAKVEESGPHYFRHDFWYQARDMFGDEGAKSIDDLFDAFGFDSIKMTENGAKTIGIRDPKNIRSRFAAFDPAKKDSADLLAGVAPYALPAGLAAMAYGDDK